MEIRGLIRWAAFEGASLFRVLKHHLAIKEMVEWHLRELLPGRTLIAVVKKAVKS